MFRPSVPSIASALAKIVTGREQLPEVIKYGGQEGESACIVDCDGESIHSKLAGGTVIYEIDEHPWTVAMVGQVQVGESCAGSAAS